jgi:hypothetical protein
MEATLGLVGSKLNHRFILVWCHSVTGPATGRAIRPHLLTQAVGEITISDQRFI